MAKLSQLLGVFIEHESVIFARIGAKVAIKLRVVLKRRELLNIEMENGAHGCADGFRIVGINGRSNNGDILVAKSDGATHNSAEIAGIGWINEYDMGGANWREGSVWLLKFSN